MIDYIPGLANVPATKSSISSIDGENGILAYRGYSIEELCEKSCFEEVCLLLSQGNLASDEELKQFKKEISSRYEVTDSIVKVLSAMPVKGHPMSILQSAIAAMATLYPEASASNPSSSATKEALIKIVASMGSIVATWLRISNNKSIISANKDLSYAENFLHMCGKEEINDEIIKLFDACLIMHAEHTINASTFSALVTGSSLADPFASMAAAVGTLSGPLHGGANERVLTMLDEIGSPKNAKAWIEKTLKNKKVIWGMGHREYKTKDPRAKILEKMIKNYLNKNGAEVSLRFETALEVESICEGLLSQKGVYPNVDFYSGVLYSEVFKIDPKHFTPIFAMSRVSGWAAHWQEQVADNRIFRPTQIYTGEDFRSYPVK